MLHVIATVELNPGTRDAYLGELKAVTPAVRAEDGCIQYEASAPNATDISTNKIVDPNVVVILEKWRDLAALKAHLAAQHMAVYREKVKGMRKGMNVQVLEPL
jgi:quinol monooxygenase YgiN